MLFRSFSLVLTALLFRAAVFGHDGLDLQPPVSVPEAWNVLTLCHKNIENLAAEERWAEIGGQASPSLQAARFLREQPGDEPAQVALRTSIRKLEEQGVLLFEASRLRHAEEMQRKIGSYTAALHELEQHYDPQMVRTVVYSCPMCRGIRELDSRKPCFKCGMALEPRTIPASDAYAVPGEPSTAVTPEPNPPLTIGVPNEVKLKFSRKKDGAPVMLDDLRVAHTERIHLLVIDESLDDYHHEHPRPTGVPGEYAFTFTPRRSGPYRVFADVVPIASQVQEYAVCDLPSSGSGEALSDRRDTLESSVDGFQFYLQWRNANTPLKAKVPVKGHIKVTTPDGQAFKLLEPIMGTYAHIVGFYEDRRTVLHIHPSGGADPQQPSDRGGPSLNFTFYAPKPGFIRLYVQVQVGGVSHFAPFGVTIAP
jgi:hypothetical protein